MSQPILLTEIQQSLQSTQELTGKDATGPTVQIFSVGADFTDTNTVTSSSICEQDDASGSNTVTSGTTADPNATYIGSNGGVAMFALKLPNGITPPVFNNPLAAPPIPAEINQGFNDNGTIQQGLIGNL